MTTVIYDREVMRRLCADVLARINAMPPRDEHHAEFATGGYIPHDHVEFVDGCFRCDLSRDES